MKAHSQFLMDCHLAGRKYHDVDHVWNKLHVGMPVRLEREENNAYDPEAIQVIINNDGEDFLLGYIPRGENQRLSPFFDMGWGEMFECCISRITPEAHYEQQVWLTIRIKRNRKKVK